MCVCLCLTGEKDDERWREWGKTRGVSVVFPFFPRLASLSWSLLSPPLSLLTSTPLLLSLTSFCLTVCQRMLSFFSCRLSLMFFSSHLFSLLPLLSFIESETGSMMEFIMTVKRRFKASFVLKSSTTWRESLDVCAIVRLYSSITCWIPNASAKVSRMNKGKS